MDEALIKRIQPFNANAEKSVIGSMLMNQEAYAAVESILTKDDFYQNQYGILFEAIEELHEEGKPVDLITLQNKLKSKNVPEEIQSVEFMRDIVAGVHTSANVKHYADIVKEKAILRNLIKVSEAIAANCYLDQDSTENILENAEKEIFKLSQNRGSRDFVPIQEIVLTALDRIEAASKSKGRVTGVATGFKDLDYKTAGLQPSDLILVAARPSMGKTAFALNIAQYAMLRNKLPVAIFSLEMSKEQLVNRFLAVESMVDSQDIRTGDLKEHDWDKLLEGAGTIAKSKLFIDDTPGISSAELRSKCRKLKLEHDIGLVVIDYLQLMTGRGGENRQQEISEISRGLKSLARELSVPVVALSQLSRAVEQRPNHRPMLSDLRESGAIEQDADVVMFLYRDEYYNPDTDDKGVSEVIIAKQRNGSVGTVRLAWLSQYTKFADLERTYEN